MIDMATPMEPTNFIHEASLATSETISWSEDTSVILKKINHLVIQISPRENPVLSTSHEKCKHTIGVRWHDVINMIIDAHNAACVQKTGVTFSPNTIKVHVQLGSSGLGIEMKSIGEENVEAGVQTVQQVADDAGNHGDMEDIYSTDGAPSGQTSEEPTKVVEMTNVRKSMCILQKNEKNDGEESDENESEETDDSAWTKEMKETLRQLRMRRNLPVIRNPDDSKDDDDVEECEDDDKYAVDEDGDNDEVDETLSEKSGDKKKSQSGVDLKKITVLYKSEKTHGTESEETKKTKLALQIPMLNREKQMDDKPVKGYPAQCEICLRRFNSRFKLRRHMKIHEPNHNQHPCKYCDKVCKTACNLKLHMAAHFKPKKPRGQKVPSQPQKRRPREKASTTCTVCGKTFKFPRNLRKHEKVHQKETNFPCQHCDKVCKSAHYLQLHMMVHADDKQHKCPECDLSFGPKYQLRQHLIKVHKKHEQHKCDICGIVYRDKYNLKDHMQEHTGTKSYLCETCGKTFTRPNSYRLHMKYHEARATPNAYKCKLCPKSYHYQKLLNVHVRNVHMGERNFKCRVCGVGFFTKRQQFLHEQVHQDRPSHVCSFCNKGFAKKQTLLAHKRMHMGIRPFKCQYCSKGFTTKDFVSRHEKTHTSLTQPLKPFDCTVCNAKFANRQAMADHKKRHAGIKDFTCEFCLTAFVTRGDLTRHLRTHTGGRPFKCNRCDKSFAKKRELTEHEAWHGTPDGQGTVELEVHGSIDVPGTIDVPFSTHMAQFSSF